MKVLLFTQENHPIVTTIKKNAHKYEIESIVNNNIEEAFDIILKEKVNILLYYYENESLPNISKLLEMIHSGNLLLDVLPIAFVKKIKKDILYTLYSKKLFYCFEIPDKQEEWNTLINKAIFLYRNIINLYDTETLIEEKKRIILENDLSKIPSVINQLTFNAKKITRNIKKIELALYEVIINAIEHGNFEIDGNTKKHAIQDNKYYDLLSERKKHPVFSKRKVVIDYHLTENYVKFVIKDEGKGFNWKKTINDDINILNEHGRGILMIKTFFDKFEYNDKGNQITLIKYKDL